MSLYKKSYLLVNFAYSLQLALQDGCSSTSKFNERCLKSYRKNCLLALKVL